MPVENVNTIKDLNEFYPASTDPVLEGDDHLRLIKSTLKNCFPEIDGQVTATHTEINDTVALVKGISEYTKTALPLDTSLKWRQHLGLGTAALHNHEEYALVDHTHPEFNNFVPKTRQLQTWKGLGMDRGDGILSDLLDLSANIRFGLRATGVTPGTYGSTTRIPVVSVDEFGRIIAASTVAVSGGGGGTGGTEYVPPTTMNAVGTYAVMSESFLDDLGGAVAVGSTYVLNHAGAILGWSGTATGTWRVMAVNQVDGAYSYENIKSFLMLKIAA